MFGLSDGGNIGIYVGLGVAAALLVCIRQIVVAIQSTKASISLHDTLLHKILRSQMSFFHNTPSGNIIARFSKDMEVIDTVSTESVFFSFFFLGLTALLQGVA